MGEVNYTLHHWGTGNQYVVVWASMSSTSGYMDIGQIFPQPRDFGMASALFSDKSVYVIRPASNDTQIIMGGSNQPTFTSGGIASTNFVFATLTDPQGNGLVLPPVGQTVWIEAVLENCCYIRPRVASTSFTGTDNGLTVMMLLSSTRSSRSGV